VFFKILKIYHSIASPSGIEPEEEATISGGSRVRIGKSGRFGLGRNILLLRTGRHDHWQEYKEG
jgi:hypothetical protein